MKTYLITYDLIKPENSVDYTRLFANIKSHIFWAKPMASVWLIKTNRTRKEIMRLLSPQGKVYQAGTLSGNPTAVSAGVETLKTLKETMPYKALKERTRNLCKTIEIFATANKVRIRINYIASFFSIFFAKESVINYKRAKIQDTAMFRKFYNSILKGGVYFSPSGFEANFLSTAHTKNDIEKTKGCIEKALQYIGGN